MIFYHIQSATMNPCSLTSAAYDWAQENWLCGGCANAKPDALITKVRIHAEDCLEDSPLTFIHGTGVPIVSRSFLAALGGEVVKRDLILGELLDPDGNPLDDWVTFSGRVKLVVRGSKNVSYRTCENCGRHVYFAMGKRYLFPKPPNNVTIFESDLFGLILPLPLYQQLHVRKWRGLIVDELPVLSEPLDTLGELQ